MTVDYPPVAGLFRSASSSSLAIVAPGATWVVVGGQNATNQRGELVGAGDAVAQARQVRANLEAALSAAGCGWAQVMRVTVLVAEGVDLNAVFSVFGPSLASRAAPPLVSVAVVSSLARPGCLLEVAVEAVR